MPSEIIKFRVDADKSAGSWLLPIAQESQLQICYGERRAATSGGSHRVLFCRTGVDPRDS